MPDTALDENRRDEILAAFNEEKGGSFHRSRRIVVLFDGPTPYDPADVTELRTSLAEVGCTLT